MTKLHLASGLSLPIEATTEAIGFLGRRGSGKSYAAQKLAEEFHRAKAQFVVLDPVGNWYGLRLAADGKSPGIPIPVFGGLQGDIPINASAGAKIADTIVDRGISAVIDVSQFESDADKARFALAFCERFYFRKKSSPSAVHLFLEEAQEFIPQNPGREEPKMLHAFTRLAKLGRNFGIGISMLSQRPQEVNKKVLNLAELLLVFQLTGTHERRALEAWIGDKGIENEDIEAELPKLERGKPHVWSPAWLQVSRVVEINSKWTFDASSTPKVGAGAAVVRELSPIDIQKLSEDMAVSIERAKADDPKLLKARIRELEAAAKKPVGPQNSGKKGPPLIDQALIDRKIADAFIGFTRERRDQDRELGKVLTTVRHRMLQTLARLTDASTALGDAGTSLDTAIARLINAPPPTAPTTNGHGAGVPARSPLPPKSSATSAAPATGLPRRTPPSTEPAEISRPQLRMVNALASFEAIGVSVMQRNQVAVFSDQSPRSSGFEKNLSTLRTKGFIEYPSQGAVALTDDGRAVAEAIAPATLEALHDAWLNQVSGPQARMLREAIDAHPDRMPRAELAERTNQSVTSSGWEKNLSTLRSLGALDYPDRDSVIATDLLFPKGLA